MVDDRNIEVVNELLLKAKEGSLNDKQINILAKIINNISTVTNLQKERFCFYYGLNSDNKRYSYNEMEKIYQCSYVAIRDSVLSVKKKLIKEYDQNVQLIEKLIIK